jgi:hypothetical protein
MVRDPKVSNDAVKCQKLLGHARTDCWDGMDRYLMENVVPWVPWLWQNAVRVYSTNVAVRPPPYTQFSASTAFDAISLTPAAVAKTKPQELGTK